MKQLILLFLLDLATCQITDKFGATEALSPEIESAILDVERLGIIDKALGDFLDPYDDFLNTSGRLNDVGANGTLPPGWVIDLLPLQQLPQQPNCTELARCKFLLTCTLFNCLVIRYGVFESNFGKI